MRFIFLAFLQTNERKAVCFLYIFVRAVLFIEICVYNDFILFDFGAHMHKVVN